MCCSCAITYRRARRATRGPWCTPLTSTASASRRCTAPWAAVTPPYCSALRTPTTRSEHRQLVRASTGQIVPPDNMAERDIGEFISAKEHLVADTLFIFLSVRVWLSMSHIIVAVADIRCFHQLCASGERSLLRHGRVLPVHLPSGVQGILFTQLSIVFSGIKILFHERCDMNSLFEDLLQTWSRRVWIFSCEDKHGGCLKRDCL